MQNKSTINVSRRRRFPFKISQNCRISQYCPFPELMNDPWLGVSLLFLLVVLVLRSTFIKLYPKFRMFDYYYYRIYTPITASLRRILGSCVAAGNELICFRYATGNESNCNCFFYDADFESKSFAKGVWVHGVY